MKLRIPELDALRGIAALAVVLYHYTFRYGELFHPSSPSPYEFMKVGKLGVSLFFIISGFVIYMTMSNWKGIKDFGIKRAVRLYPAYIVCVILTFSLVYFSNLSIRSVGFTDALVNLTMLQGFAGFPHVDGVYWSLTVEITFYFIIGLVFLLKLQKRIEYVCIAWLVASAAFSTLHTTIHFPLLSLVYALSIAQYCNLFIAGIMFYLLRNKKRTIHHIIVACCLLYEFIFQSLATSIVVSCFFALFYGLATYKLKLLNNKVLTYLGVISYSLYLLHQNIGYIIINILEKVGLTSDFYLIIPIAICIGIASVITFYVEKPVQKYFRREKQRRIRVVVDNKQTAHG